MNTNDYQCYIMTDTGHITTADEITLMERKPLDYSHLSEQAQKRIMWYCEDTYKFTVREYYGSPVVRVGVYNKKTGYHDFTKSFPLIEIPAGGNVFVTIQLQMIAYHNKDGDVVTVIGGERTIELND